MNGQSEKKLTSAGERAMVAALEQHNGEEENQTDAVDPKSVTVLLKVMLRPWLPVVRGRTVVRVELIPEPITCFDGLTLDNSFIDFHYLMYVYYEPKKNKFNNLYRCFYSILIHMI